MKKILFAMTLAAFAGTSMAQNSAINKARRIFDEAVKTVEYKEGKITKTRTEIDWDKTKEAQTILTPVFDNPKTKDFVSAWRLQGDISSRYLSAEINKAAANEPLDTLLFYKSLNDALGAYYKVVELDKTGTQAGLVLTYFQRYRIFYYYAGAFFDQNGDRAKACEAFENWLDYPTTYQLVDATIMEGSAGNVDPHQVAFYAALSAYNAQMYDRLAKYKELAWAYTEQPDQVRLLYLAALQAQGDTAAWEKMAKEMVFDGSAPAGTMQNLLNHYSETNQTEKMKEMALKVCEIYPEDFMGPFAMGIIYQNEEKWEESEEWFRRASQINPESADALRGIGIALYRRALEIYDQLPTQFKNVAERDKAEKPVKDLCWEAAGFFEQVRDMVPEKLNNWAYNLMQIYTILDQQDKLKELKAITGDED